jgi:dTDP-4-dehydrorhamnose 3,5-epimerase
MVAVAAVKAPTGKESWFMSAPSFRTGKIDDVVMRFLDKQIDERGWLCELYRLDELPAMYYPAMGYMSLTQPGVLRGPHEHRRQTDHFCFLGPARFRMYMWDNRPDSPTYGVFQEERIAPNHPVCVIVPPGVVHGYQNADDVPGLLLNFPDQLYRGAGKLQPVDEIRHEDDPFSPFKMELKPRSGKRRRRDKVV